MRTYIYIDGFNFYYLAVKKTPYKWLDFKSLFVKLLGQNHDISAIKYYTALVSGIKDPQQPIRQQIYLNALQTYIPELSVHYGSFLTNKKWMPLVNPISNTKFVEVIKTDEKGSDVNLAVHLVNDAWKNYYDCAVIVSNDSDLYEAMRIVKDELNKLIGLIILPRGNPSVSLLNCANFKKAIRNNLLKNSQLPDPIPNTNINKPATW
ncbi:MAG: NYN domain-containing protein [Actinobacteria bacterium]|nr:NYN domain-containing protein [Actinomycetota bacterium]